MVRVDHVCNLKEFKVLVKGDEKENRWIEVLHSGLRNDNEPETFPLVYPNWNVVPSETGAIPSDNLIPVQYVKIQPLAAWGNSFNYSIWYVELRGIEGGARVSLAAARWGDFMQRESWRLCLSFLRGQPAMEEAFMALQRQTGVQLEDPLVSRLFQLVVAEGSFAAAESLISEAHNNDPTLFQEYIEENIPYIPQWTRLDHQAVNPDGNPTGHSRAVPAVRGGHQMCWDPVGRAIYLLGGWDGHRDLGDFWRFDVLGGEWVCLSEDARREGGPGPRSCHKMVIHSGLRRLFVFGRYVDTETRASIPLTAEFYYYDLDRHVWSCIAEDVQASGGPGLIYDHQMAIDEDRNVIYVFGGRLINQPSTASGGGGGNTETHYSGLFSYDINGGHWRLIRSDPDPIPGSPTIKSRIGHSMIFNPITRQLYVFAGQRHKDYLWYASSPFYNL